MLNRTFKIDITYITGEILAKPILLLPVIQINLDGSKYHFMTSIKLSGISNPRDLYDRI
jgi:hypothetical protein